MTKIDEFLRNQSGSTAIEYCLIAAGIAGGIVLALTGLAANVVAKYSSVSAAIK